MKKNVASQVIGAQMVSATDGSAFTGTVSVAVTGDGGTQSAGGGTVTHEGNGFHSYTPTQAETNFDHIAFTFTGTGAIPVTIQVYTSFPQTGDGFARLGAPAGASVSADIAAIEAQTDDIGVAGAGLTAVPWNSAWDAEVESEVADGLAVYDPPTFTELDARTDAIDAAIAAVQADTNDLQTRLPAALVGGRIDANVGAISGDAVAADNLEADYDETGLAFKTIRQGTAQGGAAGSITLDAGASAVDDFYNYLIVHVYAGTGAGQARFIGGYVGTTKVASVSRNFATAPDATSKFRLIAFDQVPGASAPTVAQIADGVWDEARAGHVTAGTFGERVLADAVAVSGDTVAADNLELFTEGTALGTLPKVDAQQVGGATPQTAADITNSVYDELTSESRAVGSYGQLMKDNLNASVSSRASQASLDTVDDLLDTEITDIRNRLPAALVGGRMDSNVGAWLGTVPATPTVPGVPEVDVTHWVGSLVNALIAGRVDANAQVVGDKTGYTLTSGERDAIVTAIMSFVQEGTLTTTQMFRIILSAVAGKSAGHAAGTPTYRNVADTANRISATTDVDGNRTAVTLNGA
jgi:hypothetical protein